MLGSITPLGERSRGRRWGITVTAFALAATAAGAGLGAVLGAAGGLVGLSATTRTGLLAAAVAVAVAVDLVPGLRAPGPRRQVNEAWLHRYRGWVYGAGFGLQLGLGVTTIVSTAAVYAEFDRQRPTAGEPRLPDGLIEAVRAGDPSRLAPLLRNDLQPAALALAPYLTQTLAAGQAAGALAGLVSGSGPTCAFLAADAGHARELAGKIATSEHCRFAVAVAGGLARPSWRAD